MSVLSSTQKRRRRIPNKVKLKSTGDHDEFLSRIKKTLYYGKIPLTERFSLPVSELAAELYTNVKSGHSLERLCVEETAEISRNACVSPCSLILALFYLERLKTCNPDYIDRVSPSELFVVSMMVASKFLHDDGEEDEVFNDEWAHSAGIDVHEINRYEKDFLNAINWEVFVNETAFWTGLKGIEREVARREGRRRGWFSYTELVTLLDLVDAWSLAHTLVVVSVVCLTSYTASVMTLVGSAMIASQVILPASILQLHTQTQPIISSIIPTDHSLNINNSTCFMNNLLEINDLFIHLSSHSPSLLYDSVKSADNNDSYYDFMDKYDSSSRFDDDNVSNSNNNNNRSSVMDMMKVLMVAMETEKVNSKTLLMNYFIDKQESISTSTNSVSVFNTAGPIKWFNSIFFINSITSSTSPVNLPPVDVTH
ncbi:protein CNPPD1 [Lycorma delicatula]|uniref:protein CNPPD1 n=1 Tax=Lycorma delicatula TaxID=130591 RepID=UPI003F516EEE